MTPKKSWHIDFGSDRMWKYCLMAFSECIDGLIMQIPREVNKCILLATNSSRSNNFRLTIFMGYLTETNLRKWISACIFILYSWVVSCGIQSNFVGETGMSSKASVIGLNTNNEESNYFVFPTKYPNEDHIFYFKCHWIYWYLILPRHLPTKKNQPWAFNYFVSNGWTNSIIHILNQNRPNSMWNFKFVSIDIDICWNQLE